MVGVDFWHVVQELLISVDAQLQKKNRRMKIDFMVKPQAGQSTHLQYIQQMNVSDT